MTLAKHEKETSEPWGLVSRTWTPFIDQLFDETFGDWFAPAKGFWEGFCPAVDVYEDKENVFVNVEIPGLKREEIEVTAREELLTVSGERKEEAEFKGRESYSRERYFGRFHRSIPLPTAVQANEVEAHYKDGILTVICPKTEEAKRKEIEIKVE